MYPKTRKTKILNIYKPTVTYGQNYEAKEKCDDIS